MQVGKLATLTLNANHRSLLPGLNKHLFREKCILQKATAKGRPSTFYTRPTFILFYRFSILSHLLFRYIGKPSFVQLLNPS